MRNFRTRKEPPPQKNTARIEARQERMRKAVEKAAERAGEKTRELEERPITVDIPLDAEDTKS